MHPIVDPIVFTRQVVYHLSQYNPRNIPERSNRSDCTKNGYVQTSFRMSNIRPTFTSTKIFRTDLLHLYCRQPGHRTVRQASLSVGFSHDAPPMQHKSTEASAPETSHQQMATTAVCTILIYDDSSSSMPHYNRTSLLEYH